VLTVGTFDGVHIGHRFILNQLIDDAKIRQANHLVVTFSPHPRLVLGKPDKPRIELLTTLNERLKLFEINNIKDVFVIKFDNDFSQLSGREFIIDYLYCKVGFAKILIGYDHTFGKNRSGNIDLLRELSREFSFELEKIEPFKDGNIIVSSTKIRNALYENNIELANELLGYVFFVTGTVVSGAKRGSKIGFPTANIEVNENKIKPGVGVYLVSSQLDGQLYWGMANIGYRPTFHNGTDITLEVHLFDFTRDIYGLELQINFHAFLRKETKFNNVHELIMQLENDKKKSIELIEIHKNDFII
jgi:riboflavin kinase/FMN adenylyltransferase